MMSGKIDKMAQTRWVHLRRVEGKVLSESLADAACRSHRNRA